ncbi:MAG: toll/interleukin-1 receptor domain-containing protein [Chloroflexi bacterium]|nr:toll/interleukin-1 receptor domain-containing protein [Chloroflexota bacterium]
MLKVFLCHSSRDKKVVRDLYYRLTDDGVAAWLDEVNLLPGEDWDLEIIKAVRETHAVVVCLSAASVSRAGYVQKELRLALDVADEQPDGAIFIIPLRLDDTTVPERLRRWQWVSHQNSDWYDMLLQALEQRARTLRISWTRPIEEQPFSRLDQRMSHYGAETVSFNLVLSGRNRSTAPSQSASVAPRRTPSYPDSSVAGSAIE